MANKPSGIITLPLLDRLTDEDPKRGEEVPLSRSKSLAALKVAVRRDLEWLLNTRRAERELPPNVARSVFSYGLPEQSSGSEDRGQVFQELARRMETAIAIFEPRLAGVKVTPVAPSGRNHPESGSDHRRPSENRPEPGAR